MKTDLVTQTLISGLITDLEKTKVFPEISNKGIPAVSKKSTKVKPVDSICTELGIDTELADKQVEQSVQNAVQNLSSSYGARIDDKAFYAKLKKAFSVVYNYDKSLDFDLFGALYRVNAWKAIEAQNNEIYFNFPAHRDVLLNTEKVTGLVDYATNDESLLESQEPINVLLNRNPNLGVPVSLYVNNDSTAKSYLVVLLTTEEFEELSSVNADGETVKDLVSGVMKYKKFNEIPNLKLFVLHSNLNVGDDNGLPVCQLSQVDYKTGVELSDKFLRPVEYHHPVNSVLSTFSFHRKSLQIRIDNACKPEKELEPVE